MEDYDPTMFQIAVGEALAAWAVFIVLISAISIGSLIISSADFNEPNVPLKAEQVHGLARAGIASPALTSTSNGRYESGGQ